MKDADHLLHRIFTLSRRSPDLPPSGLPFGLEASVLAHWRSSSRAESNGGLLRGLRWGAALACAIALLTAAVQRDELAQFSRRHDLQTHIANSALLAGSGYE